MNWGDPFPVVDASDFVGQYHCLAVCAGQLLLRANITRHQLE
jgi:hypothetical protein